MDWSTGDLVWFDPSIGHPLPGEILEVHRAAQVIIVQAMINGKNQTFTLGPGEGNLRSRQDLGKTGVEDMTQLDDLHEASLLWNLKLRYDNGLIYTYAGSILIAVNPYKMVADAYGIEMAKTYSGKQLGALPPHLFAIGSAAHAALPSSQVVVISGESGSGKTESTKLVMQYLAAVVPGGGSASAVITEQILEAAPLLEAFGNARTSRNDNSSRFGKYLEVFFKSGAIIGAKITQYLLEKSRIVTQAPGERNYHVFYELLGGLSEAERIKYGLLEADKYFYLNQGGSDCSPGRVDWISLQGAMQVLGVSENEREGIVNVLASVLHLGNIYFHRRQLRHGQEGVEIGSEAEIKWAAHLLKIPSEGILRSLTSRITETRSERLYTPLSIDQALDARDALAKALYSGLFNWLVLRINSIVYKGGAYDAHRISILDIFGFENLDENSFEQLCINYANESLQLYFNKHVFKLEQAEYLKERLEWSVLEWEDNLPVIHLLAKKPVGVFHLLDDESNFPRANDLSFLEKCHYNHALNELYSRPRIGAQEFGITHYAGQVWYSVEGFLEKNRDALRMDVIELLSSSSDPLVGDMTKQLKAQRDIGKTLPRGINGRFVTMKPRTPTVAARFSDSLQQLLQSMAKCNPWFVRCVKPNNDKQALRMDMPCVLQQLRYLGMLDTIKIRQCGYPVRLRFQHFVERYKHMLKTPLPRGTPYRELCRFVLDSLPGTNTEGPDFQLGATRVFLRESLHRVLEASRSEKLRLAAIIIQKNVRGMLARKRMYHQRCGAIAIQKIWRGYRERKKYLLLKTGIIKVQAIIRGRIQRAYYLKLKSDLKHRREAEQRLQKETEQISTNEQITASSSSLLDIPAELAFIFSKSENWSSQQNDRNLVKVVGTVPGPPTASDIPTDLDQFSFGKFSSVYCNGIQISSRHDVISMPFLSRAAARDQDFKDAIMVYKLITRWSNDSTINQNKQKIIADYIVQKGLSSKGLRDEILVQICNHIQSSNQSSTERLWLLMSHCLSAFQPGTVFSKYLIKFIIDNAPQHTKEQLLKKVLRSENGSHSNHCRALPPSWLEWRASSRLADTALVVILSDGVMQTVAVDSWTTCEEAAALAISSLGIPNLGWTVVIEDNSLFTDSNGLDYVLDLVSEKELCPAFISARLTTDQFKCDSKNTHIASLDPDSSPKRPQVPPPEPPSAKRLSDLQVSSTQSSSMLKDRKLDRNEINSEYTKHSETFTRKSSHDASSKNKSDIHNDYFESDKTRSRSLDDLLISDTNDMITLTESVSLKHRINNNYQSNDEITPLKEPQPRYVKSQYAGKRSAGSHSSKYMDRSEMSIRSSAMSDTSEAPSLASHVRRVRVPSQASDVDQFLDDLFSPVLDGSLDELSDARSLAASIRGSTNYNYDTDIGLLLSSIKSCPSLSSLNYGTGLYTNIKGGGTAHQQKNSSSNGFPQNTSALNSLSTVPTVSSNSLLIMSPTNSDTIVPTFNIPVTVDSVAYQQQVQRAFLQSAMAQNIQIQQQLIAQNQALQTLLIQQDAPTSPTINTSSTKHNATSVSPSTPQMFSRKSSIKTRPDSSVVSISEMMRNRKDSSSASLIPPPPPPPLPPPLEMKDPLEARPFLDPYGRAKTVRIGKWRWPPPQDSAGGEVDDNFVQFKIRYANRKTTPQSQINSNIESPIGSPSAIDWDEYEIDSQMLNTTNCAQPVPEQKSNQKIAKRSFDIGADRPSPNSVGKLKLSNEMRQRLEQVTAGHSIRSTSTRSDKADRIPAKLEDTRRMILEQQLGGIITNKPVPDLPSVKTQVQRMESDKRSPVWQSILPPAPSGPAPPPPIRPPNTMPPAPPLPLYAVNSNVSSQILPILQDIPSFVQRQERDTFGAKEHFNDSWNQVEAAKLEMVYETNYKKETLMQRERSRSRSRSRDREIFSESVWDRSEVEGPSSSASDRENKEREKREKKYEMTQIQREKESNKVYQPPQPKDRPKPMNNYNNNKQSIATFKTHMVQKSVQEKERKTSATTVCSINNCHLDEAEIIGHDPPAPVMPLPTQLNNPASACLTYNKVSWKLHVRKEFFRPNESVNSPAAIDLIFLQIASDVLGMTPCLRITPQERRNAINLLSSHGITRENINIPLRTIVKRHLLDMARAWPLYFSRMFVLNSSPAVPSGTLLAVSHVAVYLTKIEQDFISVQKTIPLSEIKDVIMLPRIFTFQITVGNGNKIILHTSKATAIQSMIQSFVAEYRQTQSKGTAISSGVRSAAAILNVPLERLEISTNSPNIPNDSMPTDKSQNDTETGDFEMMHSENNMHQEQGEEIALSQNSTNDYGQQGYSKHMVNSMGSTYVHSNHLDNDSTPTSMSKHSLLQFAIQHFRIDGEEPKIKRNDVRSTEYNYHVDLVKWQGHPLQASLLRLPPDLTVLALECFDCILRYCGDHIPEPDLTEVKCVYTVLMHCHKHLILRDEVYCQLIKQTTSNHSSCPESAQRAWRLLSILAAYFGCSDALRPYLIEHLTSAASDRRRSCHGTAAVCLTNLRKTARCGGRKNVPSVEEVTAVSAGRSARRQIYRLPGGAERIVNTRCSTVVGDVIIELCSLLGIEVPAEQQEFSLYCIVQGDAFTMPLAADEYILDVTTELLKSGQPFYLIFCRSVWHFPLKRDPAPTPLYIEVLFNQVAPDYLEGLLLELPNGGAPTPDYIRDMARIAAILHRAADLNHLPAMKEIKFLLPKPALSLRELRPAQWVALVQSAWPSIAGLSPIQVKAQFLNVLSSWPLFGSSFFAVKRVWSEEVLTEESSPMWRELILALNRRGVLFLDPNTHETLQHWPFNEVISTRKVRSEDGSLFLDMKVGNLLQQRVIRVQTEQAHEISRLVRQYITMAQAQLRERRE